MVSAGKDGFHSSGNVKMSVLVGRRSDARISRSMVVVGCCGLEVELQLSVAHKQTKAFLVAQLS